MANLYLGNTRAGDAGVAHFQGCPLTALELFNTAVTDDGLAGFQGITTITTLSLVGAPVGDKGLEAFKDCARLTNLYINKTRVTSGAIGVLSTRHPMATITWDKGTIKPVK